MSVNKDVYMCVGYDLTIVKDDIITEDFVETDEYDNLTCYRSNGSVALFTDPMSGNYLYLGYIIGEVPDGYSDVKIEFDLNDIGDAERLINPVMTRMMELAGKPDIDFHLKVMTFTEFS